MTSNKRLTVSILVLALVLTSCNIRVAKTPAPGSESFSEHSYVDLQPGWRIRVVTPITKSGTFNVTTQPTLGDGSGLSLKTSEDFLGYETSYYVVNARQGGDISIRFVQAEVNRGGKRSRRSRPIAMLFQLPEHVKFVRILYLVRVSPADHNQGILAAPTLKQLEGLTAKVQSDPEHGCEIALQSFCAWVPMGISVQPQKRDPQESKEWVPAA